MGDILIAVVTTVLILVVAYSQTKRLQSREDQGATGVLMGAPPVSPRVLSTLFAQRTGHAYRLRLIILWRGDPGWWHHGRYSSMRSGDGEKDQRPGDWTSGASLNVQYTFGEIELKIRYSPTDDVLEILNQQIALNGANLVMVDGVGRPNTSARVVGMAHIPADLPPPPFDIEPLVATDQVVRTFLK